MAQSFFLYIQKFRGVSEVETRRVADFADLVYFDSDFPKTSHDFHEISNYIELNSRYSEYVSVFDDIWLQYDAAS